MKELIIRVPDETVLSVEQFVEKIGGHVEKENLLTSKEELIAEIKEAVNEIDFIKSGKKQGRNAEEFLNEL